MSEIDVSEEAVELVCGRLALSEKVLSPSLPASNCGKAQDMLRELRRQLTEKESQLRRASGWRPIEEAPKDGTWLWAAEKDPNEDGSGKFDYTYFMLMWSRVSDRWTYYRPGEGWYPLSPDVFEDLTHFMLITPPEKSND